MPSTRLRNVRVPDAVWVAAIERAAIEGTSVSELVRGWLEEYVTPPHRPIGQD